MVKRILAMLAVALLLGMGNARTDTHYYKFGTHDLDPVCGYLHFNNQDLTVPGLQRLPGGSCVLMELREDQPPWDLRYCVCDTQRCSAPRTEVPAVHCEAVYSFQGERLSGPVDLPEE